MHSSLHISGTVLKQAGHKEKNFSLTRDIMQATLIKIPPFFAVYHSVAVVLLDTHVLILASVAKLRHLLFDIYLIPFNKSQL